MKIHIITVGKPKLAYAQAGWQEYISRLERFHAVRVTHISDKQNDAEHFRSAAGSAYKVGLVIQGRPFSSQQLASFLTKRAIEAREVCFMIGGPDGLPAEIIQEADFTWSFSDLTFPHDLAMVVLAETIYRAATINAGLPYHH